MKMRRVIITTATADIWDDKIKSLIVQKQEIIKMPSTRVRKALARRRKRKTAWFIIRKVLKGMYILSVILAVMAAAALLQRPSLGTVDVARLVACMIWCAFPAAVLFMEAAAADGEDS